MHKINIKNIGILTDIYIDGIKVSDKCISFTVSQEAGEIPKIELSLIGEINIELEGEVIANNLLDN